MQIHLKLFEEIHAAQPRGRLGTRQWTASRVCHQTSRGQYHDHNNPLDAKLLDEVRWWFSHHLSLSLLFLSYLYLVVPLSVSQRIFSSTDEYQYSFCMCLYYFAMTGTWPDAGWEITLETSTILRTSLVPWEPATNSRGWEIWKYDGKKKHVQKNDCDPWCELQGLYFEGLSRSPGLLAEGKRAEESRAPQDASSKDLVL